MMEYGIRIPLYGDMAPQSIFLGTSDLITTEILHQITGQTRIQDGSSTVNTGHDIAML